MPLIGRIYCGSVSLGTSKEVLNVNGKGVLKYINANFNSYFTDSIQVDIDGASFTIDQNSAYIHAPTASSSAGMCNGYSGVYSGTNGGSNFNLNIPFNENLKITIREGNKYDSWIVANYILEV
ncbi:hypothetical protein [Tepidibacter hydrothermalis]|uniref:Uncharacterized protein n=1 Tax=Tepidibacter hydrothermalis TaxID=3036126 RepID=A0ABY8EGH6_9FIRM|nr:hypothetical protein [Tepidibacter hydrothermalis]WFD12018.1 hypothetical protein P4S50_08050 [Tepidibacter hydrothermalis]